MSEMCNDSASSTLLQPSSLVNRTSCANTLKLLLKFIKGWYKTIVIVVTPVLLCPIPLVINNSIAAAFYAIAIIGIYWITEAVPIAVTALLPIVLFPALGVQSAHDTCANYLNDTVMLFVGGLIFAVAIEKWNLHKRIALLVLLLVGSKPTRLLLGFMLVTAFLSMWISNTATAALMLPLAHAVLQELKQHNGMATEDDNVRLISARYSRSFAVKDSEEQDISPNKNLSNDEEEPDDLVDDDDDDDDEDDDDKDSETVNIENSHNPESPSLPVQSNALPPGFSNLSKALMLGVAYSANIGGTATLTGTGPNLIFNGDINKLFPDGPRVNFASWFIFACPLMILCLFVSWVYLSMIYCNDCCFICKKTILCKKMAALEHHSSARNVIRLEYKKLGPWKFAEIELLVCFVVLILLWLFREPGFFTGWSVIFKSNESDSKSYFSDSSTVLFIAFLLFVLPSNICCKYDNTNRNCKIVDGSTEALLDWKSVQVTLPWNVVLLLGSGFALADAAEVSGLSCWIGTKLLGIQLLPDVIKSLAVSVVIASITEVVSNVATTTLFLPILAQLSVVLMIHPFYLMLTATISASFAFMLPVATPPNAMAFSYGYLKVYDMVLTGIPMNIICVLLVNVAVNTWAVPLFNLHTFPNWTSSGSPGSSFCEFNISNLTF